MTRISAATPTRGPVTSSPLTRHGIAGSQSANRRAEHPVIASLQQLQRPAGCRAGIVTGEVGCTARHSCAAEQHARKPRHLTTREYSIGP